MSICNAPVSRRTRLGWERYWEEISEKKKAKPSCSKRDQPQAISLSSSSEQSDSSSEYVDCTSSIKPLPSSELSQSSSGFSKFKEYGGIDDAYKVFLDSLLADQEKGNGGEQNQLEVAEGETSNTVYQPLQMKSERNRPIILNVCHGKGIDLETKNPVQRLYKARLELPTHQHLGETPIEKGLPDPNWYWSFRIDAMEEQKTLDLLVYRMTDTESSAGGKLVGEGTVHLPQGDGVLNEWLQLKRRNGPDYEPAGAIEIQVRKEESQD